MTFTVAEFEDLVHILDECPEWRDELRRRVLTDDFLTLPHVTQELAEAQQRTEARVGELAEAQQRTEARVGELAEAQQRTEARVSELAEAQQRTEARVSELAEQIRELAQQVRDVVLHVDQLTERMEKLAEVQVGIRDDVADLKGSDLERRYREKAPAYLWKLIGRTYVLTPHELSKLVEDGVEQERLSRTEAADLIRVDAVVRGRWREDQQEVYLVLEVSYGVGVSDVQRACTRAALLSRLDLRAIPVVAGTWVTSDAQHAAQGMKVWQVTDGHVVSPDAD